MFMLCIFCNKAFRINLMTLFECGEWPYEYGKLCLHNAMTQFGFQAELSVSSIQFAGAVDEAAH
jgi:hypothetical protein